MAKKFDRFECQAGSLCIKWWGLDADEHEEEMTQVAELLRLEHAAMVRKVQRLDRVELTNMSDDFQAGQHNAYMNVLAWLKARKGGGK